MSIEKSFDNISKPLVSPEDAFDRKEKLADICIVTFSLAVYENVLKSFTCTQVCYTGTANGKIPVYRIEAHNILFYMSPIGASVAGMTIDEIRCATGCTKFIFFGSCGVIDREKCDGKIIVPTYAYRDEGLSYHFKESSDYIEIRNSSKLAMILEELNVDYVTGRTWTTDAFYRETVNNRDARKKEGCICVEMECSALQSVCDYRNIELYQFLFGGDLLTDSSWEKRTLGTADEKKDQIASFNLALKIAEKI